jgi:hypothetical protein
MQNYFMDLFSMYDVRLPTNLNVYSVRTAYGIRSDIPRNQIN